MANDKSFKIKNGLSAKRYLLNGSTLSGSTIDLSLASVFSTTLSSDPAYAFTNPPPSGTAAAFSVEVTGGTTNFTQDSFATTLYAGTGSTQTITNGIDLSGDGGLVWVKWRSGAVGSGAHVLVDTERGVNYWLSSSTTSAQNTTQNSVTAFNSNGFSVVDAGGKTNYSGDDYVSWTFKKEPSFFDIVTYTGTGAAQNISHNLGSVPGCIITKRTDASENWHTYHRGLDATAPENKYVMLNKTNAVQSASTIWNDTAPTSTEFTVGSGNTNTSGGTYVAYLFAHDTASDSRIKCGSFVPSLTWQSVIDLGWKPQWIMYKKATSTGDWYIVDTLRGIVTGAADPTLFPNKSDAEVNYIDSFSLHPNGFEQTFSSVDTNEYIYMAIRGDSSTDSAITWPSSVKWPSGLAPTTPAPGTKDLFTFLTTDGGTTYYGKKAGSDIA